MRRYALSAAGRSPLVGGLVAVLAAVFAACAASGASPPGFGDGGFAIFEGGEPTATGVQERGRILLAGGGSVWALTAEGAPDMGFRAGPLLPALCNCQAELAVQPDDRIVVALQQTVLRLMPTGAPDTSFGSGGRTLVPRIEIQSLALAPDGAIVVAGAQVAPGGSIGQPGGPSAVARIVATGALDSSFGRGGIALLDEQVGWPVDVAVQSDGGVVVVGQEDGSRVARLDSSGEIDRAFGEEGFTDMALFRGTAILVQRDDKIVVAGTRWRSTPDIGYPVAVATRFDVLGRQDVSFGQEGVSVLGTELQGYDSPADLALEPDGSLVVAGTSFPTTPKGASWFVRKLAPDGTLSGIDRYHGPGLTDPDQSCWGEGANAVAVQADGKVVVAGGACDYAAVVARYTADLQLDAGLPLRVRRIRPQGTAVVRAGRAGSAVRLSTTVRANAAARVVVSVRRADLIEGIPGKMVPRPRGGRVVLLPGSAAGVVTLKRAARTIEADLRRSGELRLRLLLPARVFPRGRWGVATVHARDDRGRTSTLDIEFVTR